MSLRLDLEPGQTVKIGDDVSVTLVHKSGRRAKLIIDSNKPVTVVTPPDDRKPRHDTLYVRKSLVL